MEQLFSLNGRWVTREEFVKTREQEQEKTAKDLRGDALFCSVCKKKYKLVRHLKAHQASVHAPKE